MLDQTIPQPTPGQQAAAHGTRDDLLYHTLRREFETVQTRNYWYQRHLAAGTLLGQRRRAANNLGAEGESVIVEMIRQRGLQVNLTTKQCPFDLWVADSQGRAARVEVKTSLYHRGRYQANIRQHTAVDLLIFLAKNGAWWPYLIPIAAIGSHHNIAIWSACPGDYKGQWSSYLNAWQHLEQAITARPQNWQLSLLDTREN